MSQPGIPPSADRVAFRLKTILIGGGIIVAGIAMLVLFALQDLSPTGASLEEMGRIRNTREADELRERSSAFNAVQRFVFQVIDDGGILDVAWLNTQHEGHRGYYKYTGIVAIADEEENVTRYKYLVVVELMPERGWKMLQREVSPADR
ncbi:MAG: hypothetical protein GWP08_14065 [Nitrospiraceae bacterium]|nr:hypothetical protein [Nitrospiraceae bacterium]